VIQSNTSRPPSGPATDWGGEKGILFTWGGSFSLSDGGGGSKPDNHKGCLGTGDKEGRLVPTRVLGELENQVVVQVSYSISFSHLLLSSFNMMLHSDLLFRPTY
jgi:hypothetical protein